MTELQEARLLGRAIRSRWNIPDDTKSDVIEELHRLATKGVEESARIAACRALIAAEGQNQRDEHSDANEFKQRILQLADQFGIDLSAPGAIEGNAASDPVRASGRIDEERA